MLYVSDSSNCSNRLRIHTLKAANSYQLDLCLIFSAITISFSAWLGQHLRGEDGFKTRPFTKAMALALGEDAKDKNGASNEW